MPRTLHGTSLALTQDTSLAHSANRCSTPAVHQVLCQAIGSTVLSATYWHKQVSRVSSPIKGSCLHYTYITRGFAYPVHFVLTPSFAGSPQRPQGCGPAGIQTLLSSLTLLWLSVGLPKLAKHKGHPVKFEFQISNPFFRIRWPNIAWTYKKTCSVI